MPELFFTKPSPSQYRAVRLLTPSRCDTHLGHDLGHHVDKDEQRGQQANTDPS